MRTPEIVVYHGNCQDGFTAAWVIHNKLGDYPEYVAGHHGSILPPETFAGKDVLFVDFTYKKNTMLAISEFAKSIVILDHHESAEEDLASFPSFEAGDEDSYQNAMAQADDDEGEDLGMCPIIACFDMKRSGAALAWEHFNPNQKSPFIVRTVQDRDLWRFELSATRDICAYLYSLEYSFDNWDDANELIEDPEARQSVMFAGQAIQRKLMRDIHELLPLTKRFMEIGGILVQVANMPYFMASEAGNILAAEMPMDFGATYWIDNDANAHFSLRSVKGTGMNVAKIAVSYGGGGHANAAGFKKALFDLPAIWRK